jgi:hypothetical protein
VPVGLCTADPLALELDDAPALLLEVLPPLLLLLHAANVPTAKTAHADTVSARTFQLDG